MCLRGTRCDVAKKVRPGHQTGQISLEFARRHRYTERLDRSRLLSVRGSFAHRGRIARRSKPYRGTRPAGNRGQCRFTHDGRKGRTAATNKTLALRLRQAVADTWVVVASSTARPKGALRLCWMKARERLLSIGASDLRHNRYRTVVDHHSLEIAALRAGEMALLNSSTISAAGCSLLTSLRYSSISKISSRNICLDATHPTPVPAHIAALPLPSDPYPALSPLTASAYRARISSSPTPLT